ncbi:MAG: InlB B-repeat-containing protein, partial [Clostridia bacterium]
IDYTISYTLDGGTVVSNKDIYNVETADFALNNPTKVGYTFKGWSGTALTGDQNLNVTIAKGGNGNRTYTANWTINQYTFTYSAENGTISTNIVGLVSGGKVDFGTVVTMTATANVGYTFEAWNVDGTDVSTLTTYSVTVGAKDCVVKARFKANDATSYTVLHYTEDLVGGGKTLFATDNLSGKTDTLATATAKIKAGFTAPTIMPNGKIVGDGSLAIEVLYTRNSYNMTIGSAVTLQKFEAEVALGQETKLGFAFGGWSCSVDGKVYNGAYKMPAQDAVMTAIWTLNAPTVSISGHTSAVTYDPNKTVILTANAGHTLGSSVLSYKWFKGDAEIVGQTGATLSLKNVADSGSYKVVVLATSDGQTKQAEATQVVAINPADLIVTAEAYKQQYDGLAHSIVVTAPAGATIEYSLDNSVWSVTNPTFTNKQSAVVVNYRVNKTNYNQFASNASVTIDARVITVKAQAQTAKYSGLTPTFDNIKWETSVNSIVQGENLGIVLSCKTLGINAGSYPIEVGYSGNEAVRANYQITCINGSFEIEKLAVNIKLLNQNAVFSKAEPTVGNVENIAWQYVGQNKFVTADTISFTIECQNWRLCHFGKNECQCQKHKLCCHFPRGNLYDNRKGSCHIH